MNCYLLQLWFKMTKKKILLVRLNGETLSDLYSNKLQPSFFSPNGPLFLSLYNAH